ncbi:hypothetical protein TVAG_198990 [Trichomonas vaginalis G3]|uniref:Uncharacterized protein n=1 Tax=Trichomonas vaginalis (strain ATCC PRA-98 / G3) TaxID=412133 RepID=A2DDT4_TRIV3|nr:hypothetical protein TVAGG3_0999490 [Trichomonas vaginalis G3]EAY21460.1 hypothetical protein TVAG_198990 [Trichomonas vaginalis G3]KAI5490673.1 hypothetical protein TVAGG3_0999490 [Trichomonas vaginalis G3]|eukprot:XP_001582446.1 hypothetical protein [Trichomonas vaginalis G3]
MNTSISFLTLKSIATSPFYSRPAYLDHSSSVFSHLTSFKQIASTFYSSNPHLEANFHHSKFIKSLSTPIYYSSLQIFTKTQFVKRNQTKFQVSDCQFLECRSTDENEGGGAIHIEHTPTISISKSSFISCFSIIAQEDGGAIYLSGVITESNLQSNCFIQCSASRKGHAFAIKSNKCLLKQNYTSISRCPVFYKKQQKSAIFVKSEMHSSDINITKCDAMYSPAFSINNGKVGYGKYFNLENNTVGKSFILFDYTSKASSNPTIFDSWNIIFNDYKNRMKFEVKNHSIINTVLIGGEQDYYCDMVSGTVNFINCRSEKVIKFELEGEQETKLITRLHTLHVFPKKNITLNPIAKINNKGCQVQQQPNVDDEKLPLVQFAAPFMVAALGIVVTVVSGIIVKIATKSPIKRDDEESLRLRTP